MLHRWKLRSCNSPGDPNGSPRCGALTTKYGFCQAPGVKLPDGSYSRCRMHGGAAALSRWKHGRHSTAHRAEAAEVRARCSTRQPG